MQTIMIIISAAAVAAILYAAWNDMRTNDLPRIVDRHDDEIEALKYIAKALGTKIDNLESAVNILDSRITAAQPAPKRKYTKRTA